MGLKMMHREIVLVVSCALLSGCGGIPTTPSFNLPNFNMPSVSAGGGSGTSVPVTSIPAGAEASFGKDGQSCTTPCTLRAPNVTGTYNVDFRLNGYQPQSVPVRITVNESSSMQSGDAGIASTTVVSPDPIMAELEPFAPAAMKSPATRTKAKAATKTAGASTAPPASSPPLPAPPPIPSPLGATPAAMPPNVR